MPQKSHLAQVFKALEARDVDPDWKAMKDPRENLWVTSGLADLANFPHGPAMIVQISLPVLDACGFNVGRTSLAKAIPVRDRSAYKTMCLDVITPAAQADFGLRHASAIKVTCHFVERNPDAKHMDLEGILDFPSKYAVRLIPVPSSARKKAVKNGLGTFEPDPATSPVPGAKKPRKTAKTNPADEFCSAAGHQAGEAATKAINALSASSAAIVAAEHAEKETLKTLQKLGCRLN